ncbi:hypothetical protein [Mesorhizobium sp. M8A.F.Ca.ET.165.01.1.1]|uniref:hypothetical protein n=1 Tax=Mesorhizobium sp. M8A.F.Ca.ET.165.01.1.1 TaxID=2563960 RepID=UPI001093F193|nr:hypothetical protein [Mesorhizobium sp. M8A.F.Ca.ET.165.01.1.1]TGT35780.1 hypothetical protein EN808_31595 [Mesorhizobium sp. M8A.F.Ca.ET.165.01.1.1]
MLKTDHPLELSHVRLVIELFLDKEAKSFDVLDRHHDDEMRFACSHLALRVLLGRAHGALEVVNKVHASAVKFYRHNNGNICK